MRKKKKTEAKTHSLHNMQMKLQTNSLWQAISDLFILALFFIPFGFFFRSAGYRYFLQPALANVCKYIHMYLLLLLLFLLLYVLVCVGHLFANDDANDVRWASNGFLLKCTWRMSSMRVGNATKMENFFAFYFRQRHSCGSMSTSDSRRCIDPDDVGTMQIGFSIAQIILQLFLPLKNKNWSQLLVDVQRACKMPSTIRIPFAFCEQSTCIWCRTITIR